jgi:hypothetical protein
MSSFHQSIHTACIDTTGVNCSPYVHWDHLQEDEEMTPLERITERVTRLGHPDDPETPRPLVTLEEFFDGNSVIGSIGCNLQSAPAPDRFCELFRQIARRSNVKDIRVQITAFDVPEWPFTDTVYVMTAASAEEVSSWFPEDLKPDETWEGFVDQAFEPYEVPAGCKPVACWWD